PWRTIRRSAVIAPVPAILHPLVDAAAHVVQPKRVWLEAADLDRLLSRRDVRAVLAIGHALLKLVAPPVARLRSPARRLLPSRCARQPIGSVQGVREPCDELPGVAVAHIRDRGVILATCREGASLRRSALVPFADGNRITADRERLDAHLM